MKRGNYRPTFPQISHMIDNNYILFWKVYLTLETKLKDFHWKIYAFGYVKDINN